MLSAVPSQSADAFPAGMLFKMRDTRRKDYPRSFTLRGGLQTVTDALARQPGVEVATGRTAVSLSADGPGWAVVTDDGERHEAGVAAVATPPSAAAALLGGAAPDLAAQVSRVKDTVVETLAFAVRASKVSNLPVSMFLVPRKDVFHSAVTRDSVPDPDWRSFAFHFKPGLTPEERVARVTRLLGLGQADLEELVEKRTVLPSPALGHEAIVGEIDRLSAGKQTLRPRELVRRALDRGLRRPLAAGVGAGRCGRLASRAKRHGVFRSAVQSRTTVIGSPLWPSTGELTRKRWPSEVTAYWIAVPATSWFIASVRNSGVGLAASNPAPEATPAAMRRPSAVR